MEELNFDQWLYKVYEIISSKHRKEITEVFSSIDLRDAKLAFLDGESPESYEPWYPW